MMLPVFFPFTHMTRQSQQVLRTWFDKVAFLSVSDPDDSSFQSGHRVEADPVFLPLRSGPDIIRPVIRAADEFVRWGELNADNARHLGAMMGDTPFLKSGTGPLALKTEILAPLYSNTGLSTDAPDKVSKDNARFRSLLFLRLAHLFDAKTEDLQQDMAALDQRHEQLIRELATGEDAAHEADGQRNSPDAFQNTDPLIPQRVRSWLTSFTAARHTFEAEQMPLLTTTSTAAFEYLVSFDKKPINALDIDQIKVHENNCAQKDEWQNQISRIVEKAYFRGLGRDERIPAAQDGCDVNARIRLYLLSGKAMDDIVQNRHDAIPVCLVQIK